MLFKSITFRFLLLVYFLTGGGLTTPFRNKETTIEGAPLELLFDPDPVKSDLTLVDDYGVMPIPPHVPAYLLKGQNTHQTSLDKEHF
ncbi:hypothetical protein AOLI_G00146870 [Acnodon oligacanthus]